MLSEMMEISFLRLKKEEDYKKLTKTLKNLKKECFDSFLKQKKYNSEAVKIDKKYNISNSNNALENDVNFENAKEKFNEYKVLANKESGRQSQLKESIAQLKQHMSNLKAEIVELKTGKVAKTKTQQPEIER